MGDLNVETIISELLWGIPRGSAVVLNFGDISRLIKAPVPSQAINNQHKTLLIQFFITRPNDRE